jgi:PKD repeat protein
MAAVSGACTVHKTEVPALSGPSGLARTLTVTALPDRISQDGASQSAIQVQAIGPDGRPVSGLAIRMDMEVGGQLADYGTLAARTIVTGSDGIARTMYTAPAAAPPPANQTVTTVSIRAIPIGNDAQSSGQFNAEIRLMPVGVILPPAGTPTAAFTFTPSPVEVNVPTNFDGSSSQPGTNASAIASYSWNWGDGSADSSGRNVTHTFTSGGNFTVTLTVTNDRGFSASTPQSIGVSASDPFTGDWIISPLGPVVGQSIIFNADQVQTSAGHQVTTFNWNFGDGGTASGFLVNHTFTQAGIYNVVLSVADDLGRKKVFGAKAITVGTGAPTVVISFSPTSPTAGNAINFNSSGTTFNGGATAASYQWDFGDGTTSTSANPSKTFGAAGSYNVTLTVTDSQGRSATARVTVTVT